MDHVQTNTATPSEIDRATKSRAGVDISTSRWDTTEKGLY